MLELFLEALSTGFMAVTAIYAVYLSFRIPVDYFERNHKTYRVRKWWYKLLKSLFKVCLFLWVCGVVGLFFKGFTGWGGTF